MGPGNLEPGRGFPGREFRVFPVRFWIGTLLLVAKLSRSVRVRTFTVPSASRTPIPRAWR